MKTSSIFAAAVAASVTSISITCLVVFGAAPHANARAADKDKSAAVYTPRPKGSVTFTRDIAPIMLQNCTSCHRAGEIGPFALQEYKDAKKRALQLAQVTESRYMPPWHADSHGEFVDERRLTVEQIGLIKQWAEDGAPSGDPKAMPAQPTFPKGWTFGTPDKVLVPSAAFHMSAEGGDVYRCFVLPTDLTEDKYVSAIEVRPGNSKIVHHVIAYLDTSGKAKKLEEANTDGQPGYTAAGGIGVLPTGALGGWAPGNLPHMLPDGIGSRLPKGADIVLQVHYHADGKAETDQTRFGIYLSKKPVDKRLRILPVFARLNIPAGDANYATSGTALIPMSNNVSVLEVMPHMHLLGKEMTVTANLPDKSVKTLVRVPNWDFNWQSNYEYKQPVKLPIGSVLALTALYDNSDGNPNNPSKPPKQVRWGEQTTDEMCIAFVWYTIDSEHITQGKPVTDLLDTLAGFGKGIGRRLRRSSTDSPGQ